MTENVLTIEVIGRDNEPRVWDRAYTLLDERVIRFVTTYDLTVLLRNIAVASALTMQYYAGMRFGMTHPDVARALVRTLSWRETQ